jgi:hypothetical protein
MSGNPQASLAAALQHLRRQAGDPSTRTIEQGISDSHAPGKVISVSHSTIAQALNGSRCPKWELLEQIVSYLGGDVEEFRLLWRAVQDAEKPLPLFRRVETAASPPVGANDQAAVPMPDPEARRSAGAVMAGVKDWDTVPLPVITSITDHPASISDDAYPPPESWLGSAGSLKPSRPTLFVGLGGSGCEIGASLERRLRLEFCGPDGEELVRRPGFESMLPYQLPGCMQFVYADISQKELDQLPRRVVPGSLHIPAALATAHYSRGVVPLVDNYGHLARNLRLTIQDVVDYWLPPWEGEPAVSHLINGAVQFPTVGRAALFGAFLDGIAPAVRDLREAVGKLASSGKDLRALGGKMLDEVDVFVAFSVAGGTGAGIFYDYLHLIGHVIRQQTSLRPRIYPLVVMPSAFLKGLGGGRHAELNAGRALLDLFRLVDHQNSADDEIVLLSAYEKIPMRADSQEVRYPGGLRISLRPGVVQTGFLFPQPAGSDRNDLHRSICSLVLSLIGTEAHPDEPAPSDPGQPFTDWVNAGSDRRAPADDGIGNRGVSTALVVSLTSPFDYLAGIISGRLLREAVRQLSSPDSDAESNREHMERFLVTAGLNSIFTYEAARFSEPEAAQGAREVSKALNDRTEAMRLGLTMLEAKECAQAAERFDPQAAVSDLLTELDVFRVQRAVFGHYDLEDYADKAGAAGLLRDRRVAPPRPENCDADPPAVPEFADRFPRRQLRWSDPAPAQVRRAQDAWYQWQTQVTWAHAWSETAPVWQRRLARTEDELHQLTRAFTDFAESDEAQFEHRVAELHRPRVGVIYLSPLGPADMEQLYELARNRMLADLGPEEEDLATAEASLVQRLVTVSNGWRQAYVTSLEAGPERAVADIRNLVKEAVKACLRSSADGRSPLIPRLHDMLAAAAGQPTGRFALRDSVDDFRERLANLVPPHFIPQGSGPMKVLVYYPADARSFKTEVYLRESINLPRGPHVVYEMDSSSAESITVVMFRTSMGLTDLPEVRHVLRQWGRAIAKPEPADFLRWRQRTGYEFGYLATTEKHRIQILHRLLCALWNGKIKAEGDPRSPDRITVKLGGEGTLNLKLTPLEHMSSWASLLRAYELSALEGDETHRLICAQLLREFPVGLQERPSKPDPLYTTVTDMAKAETTRLDAMLDRYKDNYSRGRAALMLSFWTETLPAALGLEFPYVEYPVCRNLQELEILVRDLESP